MDKTLGLGRGLQALMGDDSDINEKKSDTLNTVLYKDVSQLEAGYFQPRRIFTTESLADLAISIKKKGILQPLLVRKSNRQNGLYEIIAGERRFRASQVAGLTKVPVIVKDFTDKEALEVSIIENLQREDLNPLEEAEAYKRLIKEFHYTQEDLSHVIGKSRSHLANMMRLLDLPDDVKVLLEKKEISTGHARALLTADDPVYLAREIVKRGLNVRQTEKLAVSKSKKPAVKERNKHIETLADQFSHLLNTKVSILWTGLSGKIVIECRSADQLDAVLQRLSVGGALKK